MSCAEMGEPIDLPFGLWSLVGRRKNNFICICQVAPLCPHGRADWRHLMNTIEPCGLYVKLLGPLVTVAINLDMVKNRDSYSGRLWKIISEL